MQEIESGGGPYILIDSQTAPKWLGADGKQFFAESAAATDYEVLEMYLKSRRQIQGLDGVAVSALLIIPPFRMALIDSGADYALLAQVQYAAIDWTFSTVTKADFTKALFDDHVQFHSDGTVFFVFDAAYLAEEAESERLDFALTAGDYVLSSARFQPDRSTSLSLFRIEKAVSRG